MNLQAGSDQPNDAFQQGTVSEYILTLTIGRFFIGRIDVNDKVVTFRSPILDEVIDIAEPDCFTRIAEHARYCAKIGRKYHGWETLRTGMRAAFNAVKVGFEIKYRQGLTIKSPVRCELNPKSLNGLPMIQLYPTGKVHLGDGKTGVSYMPPTAQVVFAQQKSREVSELHLTVRALSVSAPPTDVDYYLLDDVDTPDDIVNRLLTLF